MRLFTGRFELGTNESMFAIGLVPDRRDLDAAFGEQLEGVQLCSGLVRKAITDPERESFQYQHK